MQMLATCIVPTLPFYTFVKLSVKPGRLYGQKIGWLLAVVKE